MLPDICDGPVADGALRRKELFKVQILIKLGELGALDVRSRVHAELLRLARPDREDPRRAIIHSPPNQSELASRINTRRETVSREINAMEREGLIERRRGAIVITDALRLSARLEAVITA